MDKSQEDLMEVLEKSNNWKVDHTGQYLVENYLPASCRAPILGPASVGKTWIYMDLSLHLTLGMNWMGQKVKQSKVLWLNLNDETKESNGNKLERLMRGLNISSKPPDLVVIQQSDWVNRDDGKPDRHFDLLNDRNKNDVRWLLDTVKPDVMFADSMRKFVPIKQRVMDVVPFSEIFNEYKPLALCPLTHAQQKGITSHELLACDSPLDYFANSSDLARDIDCYSVIDNEKDDDGLVTRFFVRYCTKRAYVAGTPFVINVTQTPEMFKLEYGGEYAPPLEPAHRIILDILNNNYLRHDPDSPGMAIKDIIEASNRNINYGIAYRHMQLLDGMGFVKLISRRLNKYIWTITPSGRRNLGVIDTISPEPDGDEHINFATGKNHGYERKQAAKKATKEDQSFKDGERKKAEDGNNRH